MGENYIIYSLEDELIFSFDELVECSDFSNEIGVYLYVFIGSNLHSIAPIKIGCTYQLKTALYGGRLNFNFEVIDIKLEQGIVYCTIKKMLDKYVFGALSVINGYSNSQDRIWHDMQLSLKRKYLSAAYLISGIKNSLVKNQIILEGKYVTDPDAFFCEIGYGFFGMYGYMGSNFEELEEILANLLPQTGIINIIWTDLAQSQLMINNTQDFEYPYEFISEAQYVLREYCHLNLR
ncbi:hypothetical protein [Thorsellia anophelis]|uniref:Barstar (barnase inhibitor) domain-containing protein n=1 Tax=Thorsellia anophelis DSM 18579 TaxID=1123402 RepID=A0A1H9Y2A0_9GAMM|nr:hypothetical protein [Thorsellia anophelis]SES62847.1 hypothetical protein SAMN02583745_00003 [Thorsellia anophelis DSM 18579]